MNRIIKFIVLDILKNDSEEDFKIVGLEQNYSTEVYLHDFKIKINGNLDRVDRIDNSIRILDYKTGEKHNKHKAQLEEYEMALQEMNYTVAKKALIYIGESIEIVTL